MQNRPAISSIAVLFPLRILRQSHMICSLVSESILLQRDYPLSNFQLSQPGSKSSLTLWIRRMKRFGFEKLGAIRHQRTGVEIRCGSGAHASANMLILTASSFC